MEFSGIPIMQCPREFRKIRKASRIQEANQAMLRPPGQLRHERYVLPSHGRLFTATLRVTS